MSPDIRLLVQGGRACFVRPEMKVERISYDMITPVAARLILGAIYLKQAFAWEIVRIHVLRSIRFESIRESDGDDEDPCEQNGPTTRPRRCITLLRDVGYMVEADLRLTPRAGPSDTREEHLSVFMRRARDRQFFQQPCLGERAFPAEFTLLEPGTPNPASQMPPEQQERDLGWMLHDIDFTNGQTSRFFRARLHGGVLDVRSALGHDLP